MRNLENGLTEIQIMRTGADCLYALTARRYGLQIQKTQKTYSELYQEIRA